MNEVTWASGRWQVKEGQVDEFVERWRSWLEWTSETVPGFRWARLLRSDDDPSRFTSVSDWDDEASLKAWNTTPGFSEKFEPVKEPLRRLRGRKLQGDGLRLRAGSRLSEPKCLAELGI